MLVCAAIIGLAVMPSASQPAASDIVIHSIKAQFADVKDRVQMAIENRGLVINYTAHVGDMLDRTGKDLGRGRRVYDQAEVLEFCSAGLSRDTMEADPRNIAFCPYAIAIYVLPGEAGKVYVSYRKPSTLGSAQSVKALQAVAKLLDEIVREALQ